MRHLPLPTQVLRAVAVDVINVLESIDLLERCLAVKRGVQWKGPPHRRQSTARLPTGGATRFKDLLRKQPIRKRAAAELLAVNGGKKFRPEHGVRRSAHAARGAVFARLEDPMRRDLHQALEDVEAAILARAACIHINVAGLLLSWSLCASTLS